MTDPDQYSSALSAAASLEKSMAELTGEIGKLKAFGQHNRHLIIGLACSLVLDVLLSVVVYFVAVQARDASSQAAQNRQAAVISCAATNQARALSTQLWTYVLDEAQKTNPDAVKQKQIDDLRRYMASAYALRVCP